jgi:RNA polymerase sigma factor (sigma-70 family)
MQQSEIDTIRAALARLSTDQRAMLELQMAGLSNQEIGAMLGKSAGAVRVLRFRAHQALRQLLTEPPQLGRDAQMGGAR